MKFILLFKAGNLTIPLNKAYDYNQDTQHRYSHNGVYEPERAALHDQIIEHYSKDRSHDRAYKDFESGSPEKHAVFTMGSAGSGKSYYAKNKFLKHSRFHLVDPDDIKKHLPEYDPDLPQAVHEESSEIGKRLQNVLHEKGKSYVFDGTGANPDSLAKKMKSAKAAGYQVHLHYAALPVEDALQRNSTRVRKVDPADLRHQHAAIRSSFPQVKHLADKVRVFDSTAEDVRPPSPFAVARQAKITSRTTGTQELAKALDILLNGRLTKAMSHSHDSHATKRLRTGKHTSYVGYVKDGHFHVEDVEEHGISDRKITGKKPHHRPIPLSIVAQRGHTIEDYN